MPTKRMRLPPRLPCRKVSFTLSCCSYSVLKIILLDVATHIEIAEECKGEAPESVEEHKGNEEKDENEKLLDLSKNLQESGKQRKNSEGGAAGVPTLEKSASGGGTDVRLPPFVRAQLDCIRDAKNADGNSTHSLDGFWYRSYY